MDLVSSASPAKSALQTSKPQTNLMLDGIGHVLPPVQTQALRLSTSLGRIPRTERVKLSNLPDGQIHELLERVLLNGELLSLRGLHKEDPLIECVRTLDRHAGRTPE